MSSDFGISCSCIAVPGPVPSDGVDALLMGIFATIPAGAVMVALPVCAVHARPMSTRKMIIWGEIHWKQYYHEWVHGWTIPREHTVNIT